jgi:hypothetical protein
MHILWLFDTQLYVFGKHITMSKKVEGMQTLIEPVDDGVKQSHVPCHNSKRLIALILICDVDTCNLHDNLTVIRENTIARNISLTERRYI